MLDYLVESVKQQMNMIDEVDQPGSDIASYVNTLSHILTKNIGQFTELKDRVDSFGKHLKEEAVLSTRYYEEKNKIEALQNASEAEAKLENLDVLDDDIPQEDDENLLA